MKITFIRDLIRNGSRYEKGKSYDVEDRIAETLIAHGVAAEAKAGAEKSKPKTRSK